jgi:NADPH-dependent 2,4-dienoyl-CoA reductase/sulfur reductase-like enzyme
LLKHVILGAGPAGVIAAETLRRKRPHDQITVIGDEAEAPYSRMAIPYYLINHVPEEGTHLRHGADHFDRLRIAVLRGGRAQSVDTARQVVTLADGGPLPYDRLLVATGSSPAKPPIPGVSCDGVHTCWTLADARQIAARAKPGSRVLQMGAGFIGCIIMEALAARGVKLTVVEMGDRMVPRMMGPTAGHMIKAWCESKGVRVFTGTKVQSIAAGAPLQVTMGDGRTEAFDLVINATGVKPNIAFLQGSGVQCAVGVLTNAQMQTSVAHVYAAGDCAEAFDRATGKHVVSAIQPNAADQARIAALNMLGEAAVLQRVPQINVLDTLGLISTSFGRWDGVPGGRHVEVTDPAAHRHLSLQFGGPEHDVIVGCNSVGWTDHVGVMRGLVEGHVRLDTEWRTKLLADPTRLMEAYLSCAQGQDARALVKAA